MKNPKNSQSDKEILARMDKAAKAAREFLASIAHIEEPNVPVLAGSMNTNRITTTAFSNPDSAALFKSHWPAEPELARQYEDGRQCGGCTWYAKFGTNDYGLCCCPDGRHRLETVFEHFTCPAQSEEGWGAHSFLPEDLRRLLDGDEQE